MSGHSSDATVPRAAAWLGGAGVLPFAAGSVAMWSVSPHLADRATYLVVGYGAVILSFMGAIYWGLVMTSGAHRGVSVTSWYVVSVLPALAAWLALMLAPLHALILLTLAFAALYGLDRTAIAQGLAPVWYGRLRAPLSVAVILLLLIAIGACVFRLSY